MKAHDADEEQRRVEQGREVVVLWAALFRTIRLYDRPNDTTLAQCKKICEASLAILEVDSEVELTVRHDSLFINGLRIRETGLGATSCHQMTTSCARPAWAPSVSKTRSSRRKWSSLQGSCGTCRKDVGAHPT